MALSDYMPPLNRDFNVFQNKLYNTVSVNLVAWHIPSSELDELTPLKTEWDESWSIAENFATRSRSDVTRKNTAHKAYASAIRQFVNRWLAYNKYVSDNERIKLDLHIRKSKKTRAPEPDTIPFISLNIARGHCVIVSFRQERGEPGTSKRAKPARIHRMEICYKIGSPPPTGWNDCPNAASATRSPMKLNFSEEDAGKELYIYGRWVNTRNQPGYWSKMVSATIP